LTQPIHLAPTDSILVFAVHPDDETLAAAGLLQQAQAAGARVRVTFATDGENNPWPQRVLERRWRIGEPDRRRFGAERRREALRALGGLGLAPSSIAWLGLPDQGLTALALREPWPAVSLIRAEIEASRPTVIVAPSLRDHHPDHSGFALLFELALADHPTRAKIARYRVHGEPPPGDSTSRFAVHLEKDEIERKRRAILTYRSQLVFRGRFFRSFATETERFEPAPRAMTTDPIHPIRECSDDGRCILLRIADRSIARAWQRKTLLLAGLGEPPKPIVAELPVTAGEIVVPHSIVAGARRLFGKVEHRWTFFDADGWREIPLRDLAEASGARRMAGAEPDAVTAPPPP
jgi:LmbE family N-acetylglucosaminyl deacetylase